MAEKTPIYPYGKHRIRAPDSLAGAVNRYIRDLYFCQGFKYIVEMCKNSNHLQSVKKFDWCNTLPLDITRIIDQHVAWFVSTNADNILALAGKQICGKTLTIAERKKIIGDVLDEEIWKCVERALLE